MGLFDFALNSGQKFSKDELRILDQNFNSITAYTKGKYQFYSRNIDDDIQGSMSNVSRHKITYSHLDLSKTENDSNQHQDIEINKYYIRDKSDLEMLDNFYNNPYDIKEEHRVPPPRLSKIPTFILKVGYPSQGFMVELKYKNKDKIDKLLDGSLEEDCVNEIRIKSIKFLKENY